MKSSVWSKTLTAVMAAALAFSPVLTAAPVLAAGDSTVGTNNVQTKNDLTDSDIIDSSKKGSLTIYKYDITAAEAAKDYTRGDRVANGEADTVLESTMSDYALQGVEFSYLRVGDIEMYRNTQDTTSKIEVVYEIPTALADILGLQAADAYNMTQDTVAEKCNHPGVLHYNSTQITDALAAKLADNELGTRSALAKYLKDYGQQSDATDGQIRNQAVAMQKTDEHGRTYAGDLDLGLYLLVETEVPEQVTDTTNPWFVSLPFTNMTNDDGSSVGGQRWLYDMTVYPKNQTGNPTLDKSVRNAYSSTTSKDKNMDISAAGPDYTYNPADGTGALIVHNDEQNTTELTQDIDDAAYVANRGGYTQLDGSTSGSGIVYSEDYAYRDTTTASAGDILDYILVSKLPRITDAATFLSQYQFTDVLSEGLHYNHDVKIAFYDNAEDANSNNTKNAPVIWDVTSGDHREDFTVVTEPDPDTGHAWSKGSEKMVVTITEQGLNKLNGDGTNGNNIAGQGNNQVSNNSYSDMYMVVYYTVKVNSDDTLVLGDDGNQNNVVLKWQRTSNNYFNVLEDRNYVYSYRIDMTKHFSDNQGDMSKVQFTLYNNTDSYYVVAAQDVDNPGLYYVTGKTIDKEKATKFVPATDGGQLIIYGVEADSYELTEIATDNGYTLLEDTINVNIVATDRDVQASVSGVTGMNEDDLKAIVDAYCGGIRTEDYEFVTDGRDGLDSSRDASRPAIQTPDGRTIGKTEMYVGPVKAATAQVDGKDITMSAHTYTPGDKGEEFTSNNAFVVLDVVNNKNFILPQTGGTGSIVLVVCGCAALAGGAIIATRRKSHKPEVKD